VYEILYNPDIEKQLDKIPDKIHGHIDDTILKLAENPRPYGSMKLVQHTDIYRIRVGDYRIVYYVNDKDKIVIVARVAHRTERTYKDI